MKHHIAAGFGRAAPTYDRVGPRFFTHFGQRLVEIAQLPIGVLVLDVAAGRGAILFPAAEQVGPQGHVTGIDLSESMVQETTQEIHLHGIKNAEMLQMDAERLDFPDASFDYVFCGFALFFLPHLDQALIEFYQVLKPGGRIAVSTWGKDDPRWNWLGDLFKAYELLGLQPDASPWRKSPFRGLKEADELRTVMTQAGFEQICILPEETEITFANEDEWWAVQWSHGGRHTLETMPPDILTKFKADAFNRMQAIRQPGGFPLLYTALFTVGVKPGANS